LIVERPLRIGFLTPEYPTESYTGGIGSYVRQMARSVADLGHSAFVFLSVPSGDGLTWDGPVPVYRVGLPALASFLPQPLGKYSGVIFARRLARLTRELNLDLLEAPDFAGQTAFLNLVKPRGLHVVVRLHTCSSICRSLDGDRSVSTGNRLRDNLQDFLERRAIQTANSVTAISRATADLTKKMLRIQRDDIHVTPNPVNDLFFSPEKTVDVPAEPIVLFAGRLQWLKGPDLLIRCLPQVLQENPTVRFCLAGPDTNTSPEGGSMRTYLTSLIPEPMRSRVEFTGFISPEQLLKRYQQATVCVFPSRWEGFGLAAAEAMASGKAVVVSDAPGFQQFISDRISGLIVKGEDPRAFGSAIGLLLRDCHFRQTLSAAGRNTVHTRYRGSIVGESIATFYRNRIAHNN
jgi:glycosyltransferase involved in cell wall biosynthesis